MLYQTLHYMCEGVDSEVLSLIYQTKMLPVLGMRPYFDTCAICHQETDFVAFSVREGGFLCSRHAEQDPYRIPVEKLFINYYVFSSISIYIGSEMYR